MHLHRDIACESLKVTRALGLRPRGRQAGRAGAHRDTVAADRPYLHQRPALDTISIADASDDREQLAGVDLRSVVIAQSVRIDRY